MKVISIHPGLYDTYLEEVRLLTEDEKAGFADWFKELGVRKISNSKDVKLPYVTWSDIGETLNFLKDRTVYYFCGSNAQIYPVTDEEWNFCIELNEQREKESLRKKKQESIEYYRNIIDWAENHQRDIPTYEEAKRRRKIYNDILNEGGEGYIPRIIDLTTYENAKAKLEELMREV